MPATLLTVVSGTRQEQELIDALDHARRCAGRVQSAERVLDRRPRPIIGELHGRLRIMRQRLRLSTDTERMVA